MTVLWISIVSLNGFISLLCKFKSTFTLLIISQIIQPPAFKRMFNFLFPVFLVLFTNLFAVSAQAQLQAAFTISKDGGCKPHTVQFTNTTTGTIAGVTYSWDLGNGNTSALVSPGATYVQEKVYTITLTAKQGNVTSSVSKQVTVYKTPAVDFAATPTKGCMPLEVAFTSNATPGDGSITRYLWDFGDGQTADGASITAPKHTYTFAQQAPVSLTVTNSFGCFNTRSYSGMIDVFQSIKADFTMNPVRTCTPSEVVKFQNNSQVTPGTTWLWEFGDGKTSAEKSPDHVFDKEGNYLVKLTATSPDGCTSIKQSDTLRVGNIQLDFFLPESICQSDRLELKHGINPPYTAIRWNASMGYIDQNFYTGNANYIAYNSGKAEINLEVDFGNCKVNRKKEITINPKIGEKSFSKKKLNYCIIPAAYEFTDTTQIGAKWLWTISPSGQVLGTEKTFRHEFKDSSGYGTINLEVTTDKGCTSKIQDTVFYSFYDYKILIDNSLAFIESATCTGVSHSFRLFSPFDGESRVVSCVWDFGDGTTSTEKSPTHAFTKAGEFQVKANYITDAGCSGIAYFSIKIPVIDRPKVWIEVDGGNTICGNTPTKIFIRSDRGFSFVKTEFDKDGRLHDMYPAGGYVFQFFELGSYNATVYAFWGFHCRDTVRFEKVITVAPPINYPMAPINTCDGDRLTVEFKDSSIQAEKWKWDFGDGNFREFNSKPGTVKHHYEKTGAYIAKLTTTAGNCSVTDSIKVYAWKKQNPVLSFYKEKVCANDVTSFTLNGFERNPAPYPYTERSDFSRIIGQYADTAFPLREFSWIGVDALYGMDPGQKGFRMLLKTSYFECDDTTNFANIEFRGPVANFETPREDGYCLSDSVILADSSKSLPGAPITKWTWETSEGNFSFSNGFRHLFNWPSERGIGLLVEDAEGCTSFKGNPLRIYGPKSSFTASSENVALGTTVQFNNTTSYYPDYAQPNWILPDGSRSNNQNESFTFNEEGEYYVKLFHESTARGCKDTAVRRIIVRKVNARFTTSTSYINNNGCPPAIARFTSTATNATRLGWNFGDGSIGGDQKVVTHTYNQPGIFQVWHYSYDENDNVDSSFDFIEIKGPYALISADRLSACNNLQVTLSAEVKNADKYTWDLGDGTILSSGDTKVTHQYLTAGLYTPSLILEDAAGCKATSVLPEKIIVDSLAADFTYAPLRICAETEVAFNGQPASFSKNRLNADLQYNWSVTNVLVGNDKDVTYAFSTAGDYKVAYEVESIYGCKVSVTKDLKIEAPLNAAIAGPAAICKGDTASFAASALGAGLAWRWNLPGQPAVTAAVTPAVQWNTPGVFTISLLADNGACTDSIVHILTVNDLPLVTTGTASGRICLGDTLNLTVQGNGVNTWEVHPALNQLGNNLARVWPSKDALFRVQGVSAFGCKSADSIRITVVQPFTMQVVRAAEACLGKPVALSASGASTYQWIPAQGLSGSTTANPVANITNSTSFRVVGSDAFGCFQDSATVQVTIHPLPQVNAGTDQSVPGGQSVNLSATSTIPNINWNWGPSNYLSCTNCASPTSNPLRDITYTVTATTAQGCIASDTVHITVLCSSESIFIPNAFTPNGDGLNERFGVLGVGFSLIKFFRISDRWGKVVFERRDVLPTDVSAFWTGIYPDGSPVVSGSYIYSIQVECATGLLFDYKGSVTLLR